MRPQHIVRNNFGLSRSQGAAGNLAGLLSVWITRHRMRRHLAKLAPHILRDVGLTEDDLVHEVTKPFWRA